MLGASHVNRVVLQTTINLGMVFNLDNLVIPVVLPVPPQFNFQEVNAPLIDMRVYKDVVEQAIARDRNYINDITHHHMVDHRFANLDNLLMRNPIYNDLIANIQQRDIRDVNVRTDTGESEEGGVFDLPVFAPDDIIVAWWYDQVTHDPDYVVDVLAMHNELI